MNEINSQNVTITPEEFKSQIQTRRLLNYFNNKPLLRAGAETISIPLLALSKVSMLGCYVGEKLSHYLLVAGVFIVDRFIGDNTNIYQIFSKQPEQQSIKQYNITSIQIAKSYSCQKLIHFIGIGTGISLVSLVLMELYKFSTPVLTTMAVLFALLSLDFSINKYNNSVFIFISNFLLKLFDPQFYVNLYNSKFRLTSLPDAINYLCQSANIQGHSPKLIMLNTKFASLNNIEKKQLLLFLQKLIETAEFKHSVISKRAIANRIINIFLVLLSTTELKTETLCRINDSMNGCHDHVLLALSDLEVAMFVNLIDSNIADMTEEKLLSSAKKVFILEKIKTYAIELNKKQRFAPLGNHVEIENIFHIILSKKYNLPVSIQNMAQESKKFIALVTEEDVKNIELYLDKSFTVEFMDYLEQWSPWKKFQRKNKLIAYNELHPASFQSADKICLITQEVADDIVCLNNNYYSYESLKKWYIDYGTDPVSLQQMDWNDVYTCGR
jgi:hypothetical protein